MNWDTIILAIISSGPPTLLALAALIQATKAKNQSLETHQAVNSRMSELLELARKEAASQATLDEKDAEHARKGDAAIQIIKSQAAEKKQDQP